MCADVTLHDFEGLREEWEVLLQWTSTNTIFVTPAWQETWWRRFRKNSDLKLLSVHDNGVLLGIAPLRTTDGRASFVGDTDLCDYNDFLVLPGNEETFYETLFKYAAAQTWHFELKSIPEPSPTLEYGPLHAERHGYNVELEVEDVAPVTNLPDTWDGFVTSLKKKNRHELRRKLRRLEASGSFRQQLCQDPDTLTDDMQDFFRLHKISKLDKREFMTPQRERFFTDMAVELGSRDQFKLAFLELEGVRVASCIYFDYMGAYLLYNSGYDPNYSHLSVGLINKALVIRQAIDAGKDSFDFLRGDERYKYNLGGEDRRVFRMTLRR